MSLLLPVDCRRIVLETADECPVAGHFSHNETYAKIASKFFWPGASNDTKLFCKSCDICQRLTPKKVLPVHLVKMPIINVIFGPISTITSEKNIP